jgi:uncharacterized protein YejL (UPF0352 family)
MVRALRYSARAIDGIISVCLAVHSEVHVSTSLLSHVMPVIVTRVIVTRIGL